MKRKEARKLIAQAIAKGQYDGQTWRTINGTNVQIGDDGEVVNGPAGLKEWAANGGTKAPSDSHKIINGSDISKTYKGKYEIADVIKAQGFDGLPKVVGKDEFDEAVKASSMVAQRAYGASSQEILEGYQNDLYSGEFYVQCSAGHDYGYGMYCAANYEGEISDFVKGQMDRYEDAAYNNVFFDDQMAYCRENFSIDKVWDNLDKDGVSLTEREKEGYVAHEVNHVKWADMTMEQQFGLGDLGTSGKFDAVDNAYRGEMKALQQEYKDSHPVYTQVETMTMDPSANIVTYGDIRAAQREEKSKKLKDIDVGVYATLKGYDAIWLKNGKSVNGDTIVLNRTKLILEDNRKKDK